MATRAEPAGDGGWRRARRGARAARAAHGLRQARAGGLRARAGGAWASRSSPPAAPPGSSRSAGIETRSVEDYTGFPEILDGRVKTLNPKIYAGLLAVRSERRARRPRCASRAIEPIDLVCVNLYPFERVAGRRGVQRGGGDREHRHRRARRSSAPRPRTTRSRRWWCRPRATTRCSRSCAAPAGGSRPAPARRWRSRRSRYTARYDAAHLALVRRARGRLPRPGHALVREGARPLLRREPAPARRLLRAGRGAHAPAVDGVQAARQGAVVQQPARPRLRPPAGGGVRGAGRGDRQAQQPVRLRAVGATVDGGLRARPGHRSD